MVQKRLLGALTSAFLALGVWSALPAAAANGTAQLLFQPQQTEVQTGQTVTLSVTVEQCTLPLAGARLTMTFADGYQFDSVQAGSGIAESELSYSYLGDRMVLLYLDDGNGAAPIPAGTEWAQVTVKALKESSGPPLLCAEKETVGAQGNDVLQLDTEVIVGSVTVTGTAVVEPTPVPHYSEAGAEKQELDPAEIPPAEPIPEPPAAEAGEQDVPPAQTPSPAGSGSGGQTQPTARPDTGAPPADSGGTGSEAGSKTEDGTGGEAISGTGDETGDSESVPPQPLRGATQGPETEQHPAREAWQRQMLIKRAAGTALIGLVLLTAAVFVHKRRKRK